MPSGMNEWRVKLYQLEAGGVWIDKGTGFVSCLHTHTIMSGKNENTTRPVPVTASLFVKREEDLSILLQSTIQYEDAYERQGESIIMWRETNPISHQEIDYALSFQEAGGCDAIWDSILEIQSYCNLHLQCQSQEEHNDSYDLQYTLSPDQSQDSTILTSLFLGLPSVCIENLDEIKHKITASFNSQREVYASLILDQDGRYLRDVLSLSQLCEEANDLKTCSRIAEILKGFIFLNNSAVVELFLETDIFPQVAGAMEFDPTLLSRPSYREIVAKSPKGPQCVLGLNFGKYHMPNMVQKLFRVKLLKDLMIRPLLDDTGAAAMNNLLVFLQTNVCTEVSLK